MAHRRSGGVKLGTLRFPTRRSLGQPRYPFGRRKRSA